VKDAAGTRISLIAALAILAIAALLPSSASAAGAPSLSASAAIVIDARTGDVLFARHPDARREIGSTTKLMTARLALQRLRQSDVLIAPSYNAGPAESVIGLHKGERMTVHDLLRALLLPSANDAAWDLASGISGSVPAFVRDMNREARKLGLSHTHYANPIGLDDPRNKSTARDLARLASLDMKDPAFARIVRLSQATLRSGSHTRVVTNRNDLVGRYRFVDGVKTGHTQQAGYVLVGAAHGRGASVVSVALGTPSESARDADSLALLRYGLAQYKQVAVFKGAVGTASVPVDWRGGKAKLVPAKPVSLTVRRTTRVAVHVLPPRKVKGPLPAGRRVGKVEVLVDGKLVRAVALVTAEKVEGPSLIRKFAAALRVGLIVVGILVLLVAGTLVALRVRVVRRQRARSAR
jgi:serine-type D-Ala-D-Ala carboxypeptidase (penicillin-binding protein 5/6)